MDFVKQTIVVDYPIWIFVRYLNAPHLGS